MKVAGATTTTHWQWLCIITEILFMVLFCRMNFISRVSFRFHYILNFVSFNFQVFCLDNGVIFVVNIIERKLSDCDL